MILKNKTIYLVEDDPINFAVTRTILRAQGANVILDHWGDTTLRRIQNYPQAVDLFILDLMLPGETSGYDVFDAIREFPQFNDVPVVIVSASDPDIEIPVAQGKGLNGFISKPISRHKFPSQILSIMDGANIWGGEAKGLVPS